VAFFDQGEGVENLVAVAGVLSVGAITPGPNNLIVLHRAARSGLLMALPAIAAVLLGSLLLFGITVSGGIALFVLAPWLQRAIALAGAAYLLLLGTRLFLNSFRAGSFDGDIAGMPDSMGGIAAFQLLNPKAWVMAAAVTSGANVTTLAAAMQLVAIYTAIPFVALLLWSALGASMIRLLRTPQARGRFERVMGALLIGSSLLLIVQEGA